MIQTCDELRRLLSGESRGDLGERSNFCPMKARLECGGRTGGAPILDPYDGRVLDAAEQDRLARRSLEVAFGWVAGEPPRRLHPGMAVLLEEFAPRSDWRAAFTEAADGQLYRAHQMAVALTEAFSASHPRVAPLTRTARHAYSDSHTTYGLTAWLIRLAWRVSRHKGDRPASDALLLRTIRRESDALLAEALRLYCAARSTVQSEWRRR